MQAVRRRPRGHEERVGPQVAASAFLPARATGTVVDRIIDRLLIIDQLSIGDMPTIDFLAPERTGSLGVDP